MVTIKDLCETNPSIVDIEIDLRDKDGRLEHVYRIGQGAQYYPGDNVPWHLGTGSAELKRDHTDVIKCDMNAYEYSDYFKFMYNNIPRAYRFLFELPVATWRCQGAYRSGETKFNHAQRMHVHIFQGAEEIKQREASDGSSLDGQISISEFMKG